MARKILLADDSVTAQNMGRKILVDAGYEVVTVNNGSAALKRITELKPDLIVLDVYMPGYSGLEVCQRLKEAAETASIPVLLTVGKLEPFKADEARRVRADAHIVKPFEASELLTAINRLEDNRMTQPSAESDAGWASRLSFPSKKKKDGEPEDVAAGPTFRDFRRGKGKSGGAATFSIQAASPGQDPAGASEIPRDITPEELDALSAFAAKLDGSAPNRAVPAGENAALPAQPEVETQEAVGDTSVTATAGTFAVEPPTLAVEEEDEFKISLETPEPAVETAPLAAVNTAHLSQEPAPIDRNDEPMFALATSAGERAAAEGPAPSDAELAEALRLLTPAPEPADVSTIPAHGASAMPAEQAAHDAAGSPRWVAEPVELSPEEKTISLEAEMFRTFAAMPANLPVSSPSAGLDSAPNTSVSAIASAIESRLAEAGLAASSKGLAADAENCSDTTAVSNAASSVVHGVEGGSAKHKDSTVKAEQVPAEEFVAAAQNAPKAMAAAAAAEGGSASARDATAIANIVDSVLADLRPKILEEITKRLAGK